MKQVRVLIILGLLFLAASATGCSTIMMTTYGGQPRIYGGIRADIYPWRGLAIRPSVFLSASYWIR